MAAGDPLTDLSNVVALATSTTAEQINWFKKALIAGAAPGTLVAGRITSLWRYDGSPSGGASPTTAVVTTNATAGGLRQTSPASGMKKRLMSAMVCSLNAGSLVIYDRLVHHGGMSGTNTAAQTTNFVGGGPSTPALTRYTNGLGVEAWIEIYSQIGSTGTTATVAYTDEGGNSSTSPAFTFGGTGFREQDRIIRVPLASGDKGFKSVTNVDLLASTVTAGDFGVTLAKPLATVELPLAGVGRLFTWLQAPGGPIDLGTDSDACLATAWVPNSPTATELHGHFYFIEK